MSQTFFLITYRVSVVLYFCLALKKVVQDVNYSLMKMAKTSQGTQEWKDKLEIEPLVDLLLRELKSDNEVTKPMVLRWVDHLIQVTPEKVLRVPY